MTEPVRRLALPNQPAAELRARGFAEALAPARGKHVLIALRGHPDPDGIACALAQAHIAQRLGVAQTTIGYCHEVSHRENRALVKLLGPRAPQDQDACGRWARSTSSRSSTRTRSTPSCPTAATTRCSRSSTTTAPATPPEGALRRHAHRRRRDATIFVEYLMELAALDPDVEEDRRIATALMHGLSTDTDDFMLARAADFRAAGADRRGLRSRPARRTCRDGSSRPRRWTSSRARCGARSCAGTSRWPASASSREAERDTIAQAADFLVRREDIDTCVVYGVVGDKYIEGSLRTHSPSVDPAVWLEQAFGADEKGRPYGGGRRDKGGFRIPIGFLGRVTDRAQLWQLVEHAVRTALLRQSGEDPTPGVLVPPVAPT